MIKKRPGYTTIGIKVETVDKLKRLAHPGQTVSGVIEELLTKAEGKK